MWHRIRAQVLALNDIDADRLRRSILSITHNGSAAKGDLARPFRYRHTLSRLEPFPIRIDEADHRHRRLEAHLCQPRDPVEALLARRIQNAQGPERCQALGFIVGNGRLQDTVISGITHVYHATAQRSDDVFMLCPTATLT